MDIFNSFAMQEALRRAQQMDTPAMREAMRQAELMNTPAMREATRQAELMNTPAMREATRQAELMNTPAMREARRQAELMNTPAMREATRQAELMNTPAMREAARQAELMNTPAMREATRQAELMNTPAMREATRQAELMNTPAMREAIRHAQLMATNATRLVEERARTNVFTLVRDIEIQSILTSLKSDRYWATNYHHGWAHPFFKSAAFDAVSAVIAKNDQAFHLIRSSQWETLSRFGHSEDVLQRTYHALAALSEITRFIDHNHDASLFRHSFADDILRGLSALENPTDQDSVDRFIVRLEGVFVTLVEQCHKLPPGTISYNAILNYALTIALTLFTLHMANKSEERIAEALEKQRTEISKEIKGLAHTEPEALFLLTVQRAGVRNNPEIGEKTIHTLSRHQQVRLIEARGEWLYIEYFDYIHCVPKMAWVLREHTVQINQ